MFSWFFIHLITFSIEVTLKKYGQYYMTENNNKKMVFHYFDVFYLLDFCFVLFCFRFHVVCSAVRFFHASIKYIYSRVLFLSKAMLVDTQRHISNTFHGTPDLTIFSVFFAILFTFHEWEWIAAAHTPKWNIAFVCMRDITHFIWYSLHIFTIPRTNVCTLHASAAHMDTRDGEKCWEKSNN